VAYGIVGTPPMYVWGDDCKKRFEGARNAVVYIGMRSERECISRMTEMGLSQLDIIPCSDMLAHRSDCLWIVSSTIGNTAVLNFISK